MEDFIAILQLELSIETGLETLISKESYISEIFTDSLEFYSVLMEIEDKHNLSVNFTSFDGGNSKVKVEDFYNDCIS